MNAIKKARSVTQETHERPQKTNGPIHENNEEVLQKKEIWTEMNEPIAMAFLFDTYDRKKQIASWQPAKDSPLYKLIHRGKSYDRLQTAISFSAFYDESSRSHFFVVLQTAPYFDSCHACTVVLGGAIFIQKENKWTLKKLNHAICEAGSWGKAPTNMKLLKIGPDLHGVAIRDGFLSQGVYVENYSLIGPIGNTIEQIFYLAESSEDHTANCDTEAINNYPLKCWSYDSEISFFQGNNAAYYDIEVVTCGTKLDDAGIVRPFDEKKNFYFSGCCYVSGPAIEFSENKPYFIQAGAFENYRSANNLAKKLRDAGYPSYCECDEITEGNSLFRIRIGSYGSVHDANKILIKLKKIGCNGFVAKR